jgi:hypothetical protein
VSFRDSGIEHIGKLDITTADINGTAADFDGCKKLKVAEGSFPGAVGFNESGIERIGDLLIAKPNLFGRSARFECCNDLLDAPNHMLTDPSYRFDESLRKKVLRDRVKAAQAGLPALEI